VGRPGSVGAVRLTDFWHRMDTTFGPAYSRSIAADQVLPELAGRTIDQALEAGVYTQQVWRAVCAAFDVPRQLR
jgi:hypothetical protein